MLLALLLSASNAQAYNCYTPLPYRGELGSPRQGEVPRGFALRPEGIEASPEVTDLSGTVLTLESDEEGQLSVPGAWPAGFYVLSDSKEHSDPWIVEVIDGWSPHVPQEDLALLDVQWEEARDGPRLGWCRSGDGTVHTNEFMTLQVPASAQAGWTLGLEDDSTETAWWMGLHEQTRELTWVQDLEQGRGLVREERCLSWALYDPLGELEREGAFDCESRKEAPGCSSSGRQPGPVGALLLLALLLLRRGQAGQRAQAS